MLHRPLWDLGLIVEDGGVPLPRGMTDPRPGIWISYASVDDARRDIRTLTHVRSHRLVALPEYDYEAVKIGAGPPPIMVDEGWLLIHHGVAGTLLPGWGVQQHLRYTAGAMLLDPCDPGVVLARTAVPLLEPRTEVERIGTVPNVVFPTAVEEIDGQRFVFYGMADASIGVATLDRVGLPAPSGGPAIGPAHREHTVLDGHAPDPIPVSPVPSVPSAQPVERVDKPWGHEEIFAIVEGVYVGKTLWVSAGQSLSLQWHHRKEETIAVLSGAVEMDLGPDPDHLHVVVVRPGESVHVPPGLLHRVRALSDAVLLEVSDAAPGWREDIVRLEDRYGRSGTSSP
jgi:mannose-6-phosphate isomerase-like protein (cupin superfamily)